MAASPSLSHSSQEKAEWQEAIESRQKVSDECGSGVVRGHCPYLVCVLCVQEIAGLQSKLLDPSTDEGDRAKLEENVQRLKGDIQAFKSHIARLNSELEEERAAISGKGELPSCHANGSR